MAKATKRTSNGKVKYPEIFAELRADRNKSSEKGSLTIEEAKELLGWTEEPEDEDYGHEFDLKDTYGKKIRLLNNPSNRPYKPAIAKRYVSEFLRGVWMLNLESIVIGRSGEVRDGQHRLVAFILAEQQRSIDPKRWGHKHLKFDCLLGFGVADDSKTADSYDKGQNRTLGDVIYRHERFGKKVTTKDQKKISSALASAIRLVWLRAGGQKISDAPHFPHSEAMEFYAKHPDLLKSVKFIIELDSGETGNEKNIGSSLSLAYASGLHYLMTHVNPEKANEFWTSVATGEGLSKGSPILALKSYLAKKTAKRDEIAGSVVKAWDAFLGNKSVTMKDVQLKKKKKGDTFVLAEYPRIGGLDKEVEAEERLTNNQLLILGALKRTKKEPTYKQLADLTGLSIGTVSKTCYNDKGTSLEASGHVVLKQYEPEDGQAVAPYQIQLTDKGLAEVK